MEVIHCCTHLYNECSSCEDINWFILFYGRERTWQMDLVEIEQL